MHKSKKGKTTTTSLSWIQSISFPNFQYKTLNTVNDIVASHCNNKIKKLLDVGCGSGDASVQYLRDTPNIELYGVDWLPGPSQKYQSRFTEFKRLDLERESLPFQNNCFDIVVSNQVFEHLKNIYGPLSEIHRVLTNGGLFFLSVPNLASLHNRLLLLFGQQPSTIRSMGAHVRGFTFSEIQALLCYNGLFRLLHSVGVGILPFYSGRLPRFFAGLCHTSLIILKKTTVTSDIDDWAKKMQKSDCTTNY